MKQGKILGIIFSVASVALIVIYIILSLGSDRGAPEFSYQETNVLYKEGMDLQDLLAGVSAYDSVDGDVTGRIVVEKVIEDQESGSAVVFYAVSDLSGNAAKSSRVFQAVFDGPDGEAYEGENESTGIFPGSFPEAGIDAELDISGGIAPIGEDPEDTDGTGNLSGDEREEAAQVPGETSATVPKPTPVPEPAQQPTPEPTPRPVPTVDPAAPILSLKVSEVRVKAGQGPAWVNIIGTLSDDKDSYETLFHNLSVSKYDKDKAGSYGVDVHTEDSDGNRSQNVPLTIIVE